MAKTKTKQILYVEDEMVFRKLYGEKIEKEGYEVTYAENGEEAKKILAKKEFDLIILDLIMPFLGGMRFLEKTKLRKKKIVVLTSLSGNTDEQDALNAGATVFLKKGETSPEKLLTEIKKILK